MSGIDELSKTLGVISSDIKHLVGKTSSIDQKVEKLQNSNTHNEIAVKSAHERLDEVIPKVQEHENIKNKGLGVIAVMGTIFGALGSYLAKFIQF